MQQGLRAETLSLSPHAAVLNSAIARARRSLSPPPPPPQWLEIIGHRRCGYSSASLCCIFSKKRSLDHHCTQKCFNCLFLGNDFSRLKRQGADHGIWHGFLITITLCDSVIVKPDTPGAACVSEIREEIAQKPDVSRLPCAMIPKSPFSKGVADARTKKPPQRAASCSM